MNRDDLRQQAERMLPPDMVNDFMDAMTAGRETSDKVQEVVDNHDMYITIHNKDKGFKIDVMSRLMGSGAMDIFTLSAFTEVVYIAGYIRAKSDMDIQHLDKLMGE